MTASRVRALVPADLPGLPFAAVSRDSLDPLLHDPHAAWARASMDQWSLCGVAVLDGTQTLAAALVCPGLHLPAGHPLERWARVPGAAHLVALWSDDPADGPRHSRLLAQGLARRLQGQVGTVEAVGGARETSCLAPSKDWLDAAGFTPCDDQHLDVGVRMRLDLGAAMRWREEVNRAWDLLAGLVPRPVRPETGGARRPTRQADAPAAGVVGDAEGPRHAAGGLLDCC